MSTESELNEFREKWLEEIRAQQPPVPATEPVTESQATEPATELTIGELQLVSKKCHEAWEAVGFAKQSKEHIAYIDACMAEKQAVAKTCHAAWETAGFVTPSRERTAYMDAHNALVVAMRQKWP
jgi:hypothetical protein